MMGWNDHVEYLEMECQDCGVTDAWTYWDDVGKARYVGRIGEIVGQDASKPPHCPRCGSTNGKIEDDDEDADEADE
jgi:Zn finger protein HypA/HybF involved in hydrogenase expression